MKQLIPAGIAGIGHWVPDQVITNEWFTHYLDTSDEWITKRTGISERRWLTDDQVPTDMFKGASEMAIKDTGIEANDIDMIVVGSVSGDYTAPSAACILQDRLGITNDCGAFDVAAACSGFMYALAVATQFIETGKYKNVLVVGGDAMSRMINKEDRSTAVLFGDASGAVVLQPHSVCKRGLIEDITIGAQGAGAHFIIRKRGGGADPISHEILDEKSHLIHMDGRPVYRFAASKMIWLLDWAMQGQDPNKLGWMIPHQMNRRILEQATAHLGIPPHKVLHNIAKYGNTSSASVPLLLSEGYHKGLFEKDKYLVLGAFGAGLTWSGARIVW